MAVLVVLGTLEDVVDIGEALMGGVPQVGVEDLLILWHAMSVGCVGIWHMTGPLRHLSHRVLAVAPLRAVQNLGNEAPETGVEDGMFALEAWRSCMILRGTNAL